MNLTELSEFLRERGYDVDPHGPGDPPGRDLTARWDQGDRAIVLSADASGRFRVEITWLVGEWRSRQEIAGVPVRTIDGVTRSLSITGAVERPGQLAEIVDGLAAIVPWRNGDTKTPHGDPFNEV